MINPSLKHPFRAEIRSARNITSQDELKIFVSSLLRQRKHPLPDEKYVVERGTVWRGLEEVYRKCTNFDRRGRLSLNEAANILSRENERLSTDLDVVNLKVSQGTAVQQFDQRLAAQLEDAGNEEPVQQLEYALTVIKRG